MNLAENSLAKEQSMKKARILVVMTLLVAVTACGTVEGFGRDISGASRRVADAL
ncbi:MAG: putative small secreted protein [Pseudorhodobacter sp.]